MSNPTSLSLSDALSGFPIPGELDEGSLLGWLADVGLLEWVDSEGASQ